MGIKKNQIGAAIGPTPVVLAEQTPPAAGTDKVKLYAKDVAGAAEFFVRDAEGNEVQITDDGSVAGGGGSGVMPFGTPITVNSPITLNEINVVGVPGITLTLPASPAPNARFGLGLAGVDITLDPNGQLIMYPGYFGFCSSPISFTFGTPGAFIQYQFDANFGVWGPMSSTFAGAAVEIQDEGSSVTNSQPIRVLDVVGAGAAIAYCSSSGVATLTIPGGSGGGGFPPIATPVNLTGPVIGVAGCSYIFLCSCGSNVTLYLPQTPSDGDEVGGINRGGAGFGVLGCGAAIPVWNPGATTPCANLQITNSGTAVVWRYSSARNEWDYVQT